MKKLDRAIEKNEYNMSFDLIFMPRAAVQTQDYYCRPAEKIAKKLPGELLVAANGQHVITLVEAYNGLIRKSMIADHARVAEREPGTWSVTNYRGNPQLNVIGKPATGDQNDPSRAQYSWIQEIQRGEKELKNPTFIKAMALARDSQTLTTAGDVFDYAVEVIDGQRAFDPRSPLRIMENAELPLKDRPMGFAEHAGTADNSAGIGYLANEAQKITDTEQLQRLMDSIAIELKMSPEDLRTPAGFVAALKQSKKLRKLFAQVGNGVGEDESA